MNLFGRRELEVYLMRSQQKGRLGVGYWRCVNLEFSIAFLAPK